MRRDKRPGPIKYGPTYKTAYPAPDLTGNWVSIDPTARGEPTSSIPDFSDNDNLPVPGVWYRYDPNSGLNDNPSVAGQYIGFDKDDGLEFWVNRNVANNVLFDHDKGYAGRFVTVLTRPDGKPLKWDDGFGIEFLIYNPFDNTTALRDELGLTLGIGDSGIIKGGAADSNDYGGLFISAWYRSHDQDGLRARCGGDGGVTNMNASTHPKVWAYVGAPHFSSRDTDADQDFAAYELIGKTFLANGRLVDDVSDNDNQGITPDYSANPMTDSQVFLYLAPFSYHTSDVSDAGADEVSLPGWKVWYRITWHTDNHQPTWVPGGTNIYGGRPTGDF